MAFDVKSYLFVRKALAGHRTELAINVVIWGRIVLTDGRGHTQRLDRNMLYADGAFKLAQGLAHSQAISYTYS